MKGRVLVVDDEESIRRLVAFNLEKDGYQVDTARDGEEALQGLALRPPDLLILDLMLPGVDGVEVFRRLRQQGLDVPVIMLTARDEEVDRVVGLELGADDYVTKPFSLRELVARVNAVLRRHRGYSDQKDSAIRLRQGELVVEPRCYRVRRRGQLVSLTPREFELLLYLAQHPGRVMSRDHLLDVLWGFTFVGDTRIVDVHISNLREKVEDDPRHPKLIKTVRGVGYKLEDDER